ncbi:MAG: cache domain-containing protein, partial [Lachnospiraceae bacterium]|nr:cache domain-containing protein [Lachnospiraceae bacterium]
MGKNRITVKEAIKSIGALSVAATLAAMVFFVILLSIVFRMLYRTSEENIVLSGQMQAIEASEQLDRYIEQATDTVRQVAFRIDAMQEAGAADQEIVEYMTEVSGGLKNALNKDFTGVYGIIDGKTLNGVGWEPDGSFDPVTRPWYRKASEARGTPVLIEPYQDVLTDNLVITVAMALKDPADVVALDITFPMMQEVHDDLSRDDPARIDMILDEHGDVIFHTDPDEVGHNYRSEEGTLGAAVAQILYGTDQTAFTCSYGGGEYEVCALPVENWYSVSLINTGATYQRL